MQKHKRVPELTDEEEARIQRGIAEDPDNPEWTAEDFRNAKPFPQVFPELAKSIRERGITVVGDPKVTDVVVLDPDVAKKLQSEGKDWRERANAILRKAVGL
ncbi:MAG: BrnA antitoxin family protein [Devosia sp.]|uniref:BrnA antitoxin family protein n=1 Tax=Devosia sp. TaxID=1871048 RepID=UPI001AC6B079|nr:BrnA antitoxin family protein [Devosia sp.]MBN9308459.1 BrnA antitoxin family protein [Devosia sp.]MBN9314473.1 BrnA antitoxin family protein [Devosia sp.]